MHDLESHLTTLIDRLTIEEKVELLTGATFWSTAALPGIGLKSMVLSDGPSGVRGERWDERDPSLNLPNGTALSATWDSAMAEKYGSVSASEAQRKGVHVVLGPTINLHRSPLGGRTFECFSEDPILSGQLAAGYVRGVQRHGVAATPKHYVANDFETERMTASVEVEERPLRELYLAAFEAPIRDASAWAVMSAYNGVNGVTMTQNDLLESPLNSEWGFDGVVVSDWGAVRALESAQAMQDLVMPGPEGPWGDALVAAVTDGRIPVEVLDRKVLRILRLAARVGALDSVPLDAEPAPEVAKSHSFAREVETHGIVLVQNKEHALPLDHTISKVGVFGQNARFARTQGGGSATVVPERVISPLSALVTALGGDRVIYRAGAGNPDGLVDFPEDVTTPKGQSGSLVELRRDGATIHSEVRHTGMLVDLEPGAPLDEADELRVTLRLRPSDLNWMRIGFAALGRTILHVDGEVLLDETLEGEGEEVGAMFLTPPIAAAPLPDPEKEVLVEYVHDLRSRPEDAYFAFSFGFHPVAEDPDALLAEAVEAARNVEVAVVVVGTSARIESEGFDRPSLNLDEAQNALVSAVAATGTPTIVIVNSGSPVAMPWKDEVSSILISWFGGEAYGDAVTDVLFGVAEPGGRLPMTWPVGDESNSGILPSVTPVNGLLRYDDGLHIGYRAWLRAEATPAFPFGHGLSYTSFDVTTVSVSHAAQGEDAVLRVRVENTGVRRGKHVVQVYAARDNSEIERAVRWLAAFAPVWLDAGEVRMVDIRVPRRTFEHWSVGDRTWAIEPGAFTLFVARSVEVVDEELIVDVA